MSLSLRDGLHAIGVYGPASPLIPDGFATFPSSLAEAIRAMKAHPDPFSWKRGPHEAFADEDWCEEAQGITFDGERFIAASNGTWKSVDKSGWKSHMPNPGYTFDRSAKAIHFFKKGSYRFHDKDIEDSFAPDLGWKDHLGDLDFFDGQVFCPVEMHSGSPRCLILQRNPDGGFFSSWIDMATNESGQGNSFAWCAINPWNGLLYSSGFTADGGVTNIYAYDRGTGAWAGEKRTIRLSKQAQSVQGGCFSPMGHLYLACDEVHYLQSGSTRTYPGGDQATVGVHEDGATGYSPLLGQPLTGTRSALIRCYSAFNGIALGEVPVTNKRAGDEIEGICFAPFDVQGFDARIHVLLLENHTVAKDNVFVKPYGSPNPETI